METKAQLRKRMKAIRDGISPELRKSKNEQIVNALLRENWYADAKIICVYAAITSEVDLRDFCQRAWKDGKKLYFPKVFGEEMEFYEVDDFICLKEGCFHVMEPDLENYDLKKYEDQPEPVHILVPGVAFSATSYRLGYGKGYYDRYLSMHPSLIPVGICYSEQRESEIPTDIHDIRMKKIITDEQ